MRRLGIPAVLVSVLFLVGLAAAQDTASLTGTVQDATGAVLPKASVGIKNIATGSTRNLVNRGVQCIQPHAILVPEQLGGHGFLHACQRSPQGTRDPSSAQGCVLIFDRI
jgi:hypothetical protein